jgi:hypothetical protein
LILVSPLAAADADGFAAALAAALPEAAGLAGALAAGFADADAAAAVVAGALAGGAVADPPQADNPSRSENETAATRHFDMAPEYRIALPPTP